jgi:hypothetical protein
MKRFIRKYFFFIFIFFLILIGVLCGLLYKTTVSKTSNLVTQNQSKIIIEKVGKLVFLPSDETPTIATVSDPALLVAQPFFADSKKGDQVLIYPNAKKAILYDPIANKIVNMASINSGEAKVSKDELSNFENNQLKLPNSPNEF